MRVEPYRVLREDLNVIPVWGLSTIGVKGHLLENTVRYQKTGVLYQSIGQIEKKDHWMPLVYPDGFLRIFISG
jgi:hypothetical protein